MKLWNRNNDEKENSNPMTATGSISFRFRANDCPLIFIITARNSKANT